jgi:hypothetical protein
MLTVSSIWDKALWDSFKRLGSPVDESLVSEFDKHTDSRANNNDDVMSVHLSKILLSREVKLPRDAGVASLPFPLSL